MTKFGMAGGVALLLVMAGLAVSQASMSEPSKSEDSMMARTSATEAIFARRLLMSSIGTNNDTLHDIFDGAFEYDAREVKHRLGAMADMLLAFPHLYRVAPDVWSQEAEDENPGLVTQSAPAVWSDWENFSRLAREASDKALDASLASGADNLIALTDELETLCESCHATYRRELTTLEFDDVVPQ